MLGIVGGVLLVWWSFQWPSGSGDVASQQVLSIKEERDRIVLGWSGPVQEPMSERIGATLDRYKADPRRLVLILNSPGGSIQHGRQVVEAIRERHRAIDTVVDRAGVCASMCVPIFLAGERRMADPEAYFMFHEASLNSNARDDLKRQEISETDKEVLSRIVKTAVTDDLFRRDIGIRGVSTVWLAGMRKKIAGRDVWMSAQQLIDEGSGIVDGLVRASAR
ncbi:ATP-dependent Clp protease proteolytic subunit [Bradyrhizobium sp. ORS 375]|uniref:ATP-dependent Clp protease proteolytic subunit n=1 Tax=Bradyrhizobium sp. (strain ORS 375) TaxID=566679 RepID=UPI0002F82635|nr:ATP-dependent Clp protease proteolytic subunit [Bradyrhizobium sp. ORS 375]